MQMKASPLEVAAIEAEYNVIVDALKLTNFNKREAAKILGIDYKTLHNKLKKYKDITALLNAKGEGNA